MTASSRIISGGILGIYIYLFLYAYQNFAVALYSYLRLVADSQDPWELIYAIALTYGVLSIMPPYLRTASEFFLWFIFSILFVPAMIVSSVFGNLPNGSYILTTLLAASFSLTILISRGQFLPSIKPRSLSGSISARTIAWVSILLSVVIVIQFHSIMNFSGIEDIYDQRDVAKQFGIGRVAGYILNWQYGVLGALLLAYGLRTGKRWYVLLSLQAFLIVYMVNGTKIVFAAIGMMVAVHFLLKVGAFKRPYLLMLPPTAVSLLIVVSLQFNGLGFSDDILFFLSQVYMRAIAIQGALLPIYAEFFQSNPFTYYSHVTGISTFVDYPYSESVGHVIGYYINGNEAYNANSNFWATDGIAALGFLGIPVIGVIVGLAMNLLDMLTKKADNAFLWIAMVPYLMALANTSFFTSLITSGGLLLVIVARYVYPEAASPRLPRV